MNPLRIKGLEPLVFSDGRPFSTDSGAHSTGGLILPTHRQLAGSIRTAIGRRDERSWSEKQSELERVEVHGPLLERNGAVLLPAPSDMAIFEDNSDGSYIFLRARPTSRTANSNFPVGLTPTELPPVPNRNLKPSKMEGPRFLTIPEICQWYMGDGCPSWTTKSSTGAWVVPNLPSDESPWPQPPSIDSRTHVGIRFDTLSAEEGRLFMTDGVVIEASRQANELADFSILARCSQPVSGIFPFGSERRLAQIEADSSGAHWECPPQISQALKGSKRVALLLATPGQFESGWRPDEMQLSQRVGAKLTLVSAVMRRRTTVSGWDIARKGPRRAEWLAPAGAVYFFDVEGEADFASLWLRPISESEDACRNGCGLGCWFPMDEQR